MLRGVVVTAVRCGVVAAKGWIEGDGDMVVRGDKGVACADLMRKRAGWKMGRVRGRMLETSRNIVAQRIGMVLWGGIVVR